MNSIEIYNTYGLMILNASILVIRINAFIPIVEVCDVCS